MPSKELLRVAREWLAPILDQESCAEKDDDDKLVRSLASVIAAREATLARKAAELVRSSGNRVNPEVLARTILALVPADAAGMSPPVL